MADTYSSQHYMSPPEYYTSPHLANHTHGHVVSPRPEPAPRKRPKYTRSKTGCLTCRVKKIKCDEQKPKCSRCHHSARECTWPEGVPPRKKPSVKKEPTESHFSTTGTGSSVSDSSSPPTREHSPPRRCNVPADVGLPPLMSRRHNAHNVTDPYLQLSPMPPQTECERHPSDRPGSYAHHNHNHNHNHTTPLLLPEYSDTRHYDYNGSHTIRSSSIRTLTHPTSGHWNSPPLLAPIHGMESHYYPPPMHERTVLESRPMLRPVSPDHHGRYQ